VLLHLQWMNVSTAVNARCNWFIYYLFTQTCVSTKSEYSISYSLTVH
jgi:hypothetical protein